MHALIRFTLLVLRRRNVYLILHVDIIIIYMYNYINPYIINFNIQIVYNHILRPTASECAINKENETNERDREGLLWREEDHRGDSISSTVQQLMMLFLFII